MILNQDSMKPIYVQISEWLENEIINETIKEDEKMYSQYQLAEMFNINPATAAKGLNILAEENILYKRRGLGMFVSKDAKKAIMNKTKNQIMKNQVVHLVEECERLGIDEEELITLIRAEMKNRREK